MDIFIDQYRPNAGRDPFADDVIFLLLGEGPSDGVQTNPTTGTLTKDTVSGQVLQIGEAPFNTGSTVSASTSGMPFGNSWIRFPGGTSSNNFIPIPNGFGLHPLVSPLTIDGWFQMDSLTDWTTLIGDDSASGGGRYNWQIDVNTSGLITFQVRTGAPASATTALVQTSAGAVTPGVPFHIEAWGNGSDTIGMALNGVQLTQATCPPSSIDTFSGSCRLGAQNHYVAFPLYTRVLTGYAKCVRGTAAVRHTSNFTPPTDLLDYAL